MGVQCSHCGFIVVSNRTTHNCDTIINRRENKEMLITAKEARALSGPTVDEHLARLSKTIETAAREGKQFVIIRSEPYDRWLYNGNPSGNSIEGKVITALTLAGYKVGFFYEERQFVDMGLKISWE